MNVTPCVWNLDTYLIVLVECCMRAEFPVKLLYLTWLHQVYLFFGFDCCPWCMLQGLFGLVCLWAWMVWHEQYEFHPEWGSICLGIRSLPFKWASWSPFIWFKSTGGTWKWKFVGWCGKMIIFVAHEIYSHWGFWEMGLHP